MGRAVTEEVQRVEGGSAAGAAVERGRAGERSRGIKKGWRGKRADSDRGGWRGGGGVSVLGGGL